MRVQCCDGAANMSGKYSGLSARFKEEEEPKAVYIHCDAHILHLSLQTSCSSIHAIRNALGTVDALYPLLPSRMMTTVSVFSQRCFLCLEAGLEVDT